MKTVPKLRVVAHDDVPGIELPDLPEEVRVALAEVAGVAREGLLAMSVAAGMAVMQAMFDAEINAACGPRGKHDPDRGAVRHGAGRGSVVLGGRRVPVAGRVCMDHTMLDVTDAGAVETGAPVVAIGALGGAVVPADEVAGFCETISYEVLTSIGRRVPRVYVEEFDV